MIKSQRKLGLLPESADKGWPFLCLSERATCRGGELLEIGRADVGQAVAFPVAPNILGGVQFRRVGRKSRQNESVAPKVTLVTPEDGTPESESL